MSARPWRAPRVVAKRPTTEVTATSIDNPCASGRQFHPMTHMSVRHRQVLSARTLSEPKA
jgi:hypothetical protein